MKILLLYPKWTGDYKGVMSYFSKRSGGVFPPLNLALLGALTENAGHEVEIIDAEALKLPADVLVKRALEKQPEVIGLTGMSPFFHLSKEVATLIKEGGSDAKVCIGGQHITIMEEKVFGPMFDFGFVGDGEEPWLDFLSTIEGKADFSTVPGLIYRNGNEIVKNRRKSCSKDLDVYPFAARHLLPMKKYRLGTMKGRLPFTTMQTVRGCPWKCIFCASDQLETTKISKRSVGSVVDEIEQIVDQFGTRHICFVNDVLTLSRRTTIDLCNAIIERNLGITFEGSTRANLIDDELIALMKEAGLIRLSFGLETVDEEMRKTMNKKVPLEAYREANALLNKHKVEALNSVMIGLPGETRETIRKTLDFLRSSKEVKQANFAIATPYPGTEFHEIANGNDSRVDLLIDDFSQYKRYGAAVTRVGDLSPDDLIELQNEGFVSVYSAYWRWIPVLRKNGVIGLLLTIYRYLKLVVFRILKKVEASKLHPSLE